MPRSISSSYVHDCIRQLSSDLIHSTAGHTHRSEICASFEVVHHDKRLRRLLVDVHVFISVSLRPCPFPSLSCLPNFQDNLRPRIRRGCLRYNDCGRLLLFSSSNRGTPRSALDQFSTGLRQSSSKGRGWIWPNQQCVWRWIWCFARRIL